MNEKAAIKFMGMARKMRKGKIPMNQFKDKAFEKFRVKIDGDKHEHI